MFKKKIILSLLFVFFTNYSISQTGEYVIKYPDGQIEQKGYYLNGKRHGEYTYYYKNGLTKHILYYENGELNGVEKKFYSNGTIESIHQRKNFKLEGVQTTFYENGQKKCVSELKNGLKHGKFKCFNEKGVLTLKEKWRNGFKIGKNISFYDNKKIKDNEKYDESGQLVFKESFFENGKQSHFYNVDKNGNGQYYYIYPNDTVRHRLTLKNFKNVKEEYFFENGKLNYSYEYNDSMQIVKTQKYFKDTNALNITEWIDESTSISTTYFEDRTERYNHKNNNKNGLFQSFYLNNNLAEEGEYFNNDKVGKWKSYYEDGSLKSIRVYRKLKNNNDIIERGNYSDSTHIYYYNSGQIEKINIYEVEKIVRNEKTNDFYFKSNKTGQWISYYENGNIKDICNYFKNTLHGPFVEYFDNEKNSVKFKCLYQMGYATGKVQEFFYNGTLFKETDKDEFGYISGKEIEYFENGTVKQSIEYKDFKKQGDFLVNYYNGQPKITGKYFNDKAIEEWLFYFNNGNIFNKVVHENDKTISTYFYNDGVKFAQTISFQSNEASGEFHDLYNPKNEKILFNDYLIKEYNYQMKNDQLTEIEVIMDELNNDLDFVRYRIESENVKITKGLPIKLLKLRE
jgi:uncharacterized protein